MSRLFSVHYLTQDKKVNLIHVESRLSKEDDSRFEIFVDCDTDQEQLQELTQLLRKRVDIIEIFQSNSSTPHSDGKT